MTRFLAILALSATLSAASVSAQATRDVVFVPGNTDICSRVSKTELHCTRFRKDEKPVQIVCQEKKGQLTCKVK